MKTLDQVISDTLHREGWPAYTDRPSDKGGPTRGGVTLKTYNDWRQQQGQPAITPLQLRNLSEADARAFYLSVFTRPFAFISDEGIRIILIDWSVMSGEASAVTAFQHAMQPHGFAGAADGVAGPHTREAWRILETDFMACKEIEAALIRARQELFMHLALDEGAFTAFLAANPTAQANNLRGWLRRNLDFLT